MQLHALNANQQIIAAKHAVKQQDYICLECQDTVRLRKGMHRTPHFYHLSPNRSCYLSGKTLEHLQVQFLLQQLLPKGECLLEKRFPEINRIADVVWLPQKIIFEVQCSPISPEEIKARNRDYSSQHFQVIWILHDKRYNQRTLTLAERFLRDSPYYFTNIDKEGEGLIYDQFDLMYRGERKIKLAPMPIDVSQPKWLAKEGDYPVGADDANWINLLPKGIQERLTHWPIGFSGDLIHCALDGQDSSLLEKWIAAEKDFLQKYFPPVPKITVRSCLEMAIAISKQSYRICLQILIEKACR